MKNPLLRSLENKVASLIQLCSRLERENYSLKEQQAEWAKERQILMEKNELAQRRIESMLTHLKQLEQEI